MIKSRNGPRGCNTDTERRCMESINTKTWIFNRCGALLRSFCRLRKAGREWRVHHQDVRGQSLWGSLVMAGGGRARVPKGSLVKREVEVAIDEDAREEEEVILRLFA
ncbi:unnamed protein product, partial [Choristocarpus tenellus]